MPSAIPAASSTESTSQTITYPRSTIAALSPHTYLLAHLQPSNPSNISTRANGRAPSSFRDPSCTTHSLTHSAGSAVVRLGDTAVVCGIQAEILLTSSVADPPRSGDSASPDLLARLNLLVPNVELATGCSPAHMPGGAPTAEAQTLAQRLNALLLSSRLVDVEDLLIVHTPTTIAELDEEDDVAQEPVTIAYWTLYASVHVLSLSGSSSLIDAAWAALLAALRDVRLPHAWWDADLEAVICSDRVDEARKLKLNGSPFCCTWGVFVATKNQLGEDQESQTRQEAKSIRDGSKAWFLADPDAFEDPLCQETLTIVVDAAEEKTKILKIEKHGGSALGMEDIKALVPAAVQRSKDWMAILPKS